MPLKKKLIISFITITSVILLTITGIILTFFVMKISYNGSVKGAVNSEVTITRNSDGVPRIKASSKEDIFFALGYVHAQDRLNIMEYQRALATGTAGQFIKNTDSELLDSLASIIGFAGVAGSLLEGMDSDNLRMLNSYVNGINRIRHTRHLANIRKDDWKPADVLSILVMKEWSDSYLSNTELLFPFNQAKKNELSGFFPDSVYFSYFRDEETRYVYILQRIKGLVEKYIGQFNSGYAAYISPSMNSIDDRSFTVFSYTGSYEVYPGWYPVNIEFEDKRISAITYSGLPFYFTFNNGATSFSHFSINADSQDFTVFNTRKITETSQYNLSGSWKDFRSVRIPEYSSGSSLNKISWVTEKGPILSDLISSEKHNDTILCINSVFPGQNYLRILLEAPFEKENSKLKNLLLSSDASLKGFIFKSDKDSVKVFSGFVSSSNPGRTVLNNGSFSSKTNIQRISFSRNLSGTDYIGSDLITQRDIPSIQPDRLITNTLRLKKMKDMLPQKKIYTEDSIRELLSDTHSAAAEIFIPLFMDILESNPLTSAKMTKIYFNEWDFTSRYKLQAPAIFYTTLNFLIDETFRDKLGNDTDILLKNSNLIYNDYYQLFRKNTTNAFDNTRTDQSETREMIFDRAFLNSMRYMNRQKGPLMEKWKWGEFNRNYYRIPNLSSSLYSGFFRLKGIQSNGSADTLFYTSFNPDLKPVNATALTGYTTEESFKISMNFSYSSSILSDFYYGTNEKISLTGLSEGENIYRTVITSE